MCVTNTTHRRPPALSFPASQVGVCPSRLSQRLISSFAPLHPSAAPYGAQPTGTTDFAAFDFDQKSRPKRRRKPQKPGKTAKMNDRHFVVHNYHDHACDTDEPEETSPQEDSNQRRRGGVSVAFPVKLHAVLDQVEADGLAHVVSWMPHGRCFVIHDPKEFVDHIMPKYFRQTKLTSFQRQLNLYGFCRLTRGADAGGYYHELFLHGKTFLCKQMSRTKVKGTRFKAASSPEMEPNFYTMNPVVVSPLNTSDEEMSHGSERTHETFSLYPQGVTSVFEPLPIQYSSLVASQIIAPLPQVLSSYPPIAATPSFPLIDLSSLADADRVLDEAVEELFLHEPAEGDNLDEFVHDWDPNFNMDFGATLRDDVQLGFMLEKLLED